ncbi:hypothetical protein J1N35_044355 [Gossypium stocksii]|uniref:Retrotransposon gag domain-containing protein n=1 Tax=Gossypium stocksii TaxID=47602 RepID=A0A9D3ZFX3_9ROSI|nr:hypothetical protein J1N35_044355 [Gossypium stocksii]
MTHPNETFSFIPSSSQIRASGFGPQHDETDLFAAWILEKCHTQDEASSTQVKEWMNKMDKLCRNIRALHPELQDMDWLFCSINLLAFKIAAVSLPYDFKVPKDMFEGRRDLQAHIMQYNDYMNVLGASDVAKCKAFSMTLKTSAKNWYLSLQ